MQTFMLGDSGLQHFERKFGFYAQIFEENTFYHFLKQIRIFCNFYVATELSKSAGRRVVAFLVVDLAFQPAQQSAKLALSPS
jgi:hypothetical protein